MTIRSLLRTDALEVATLHQQTLRTRMMGKTGRRILAYNYMTLSAVFGGTGYVAVTADGHIAGFVCGVWNPVEHRAALLRRYGLALAFLGVVHGLTHPRFIFDVLRRLGINSRGHSVSTTPVATRDYELRPIAVGSAHRGKGVAEALLLRLLDDAKERGFDSVVLQTETDNARANAFYLKHGFVLERMSTGYNHYRIRLSIKGNRLNAV